MQPSVLTSWRRVRGHAYRQAIGVLMFTLYTSCLWRIWPDSAHWPNKHNFFRRQWVEGMLWCDPSEVWCLLFQASLPGMGVHHITRLCSCLPARPLPAKVDTLCCLVLAHTYNKYFAETLDAVTVRPSARGILKPAGTHGFGAVLTVRCRCLAGALLLL